QCCPGNVGVWSPGDSVRRHAPRRLHHDAAELHDREVARPEAFTASVGDGTHRLPHRHVLHGNAADAGEIAELHGIAVLQEIVVARAALAPAVVEVDAGLGAAELAPSFLVDAGAGVAPRDEVEHGVRVVDGHVHI